MGDFVTFELAKKLKEKGFSLNNEDVEFIGCRFIFSDECTIKRLSTIGAYEKGYLGENIDCPTIQQVLKWLRDEKKLHIEFVGNACGYLYIVSDIPSEGGTDRYCSYYSGPNDGGTWDKYEDCALNAIQYVLDNMI